MKFYFYTNKLNDGYEIVQEDSLEDFRDTLFVPSQMDFCGVAIETDSFEKAVEIYKNPNCGFGECMISDEPIETLTKRKMTALSTEVEISAEETARHLDRIRCLLSAKLANTKMREAAELFWKSACDMHRLNGSPENVTPDAIYKLLVEASIRNTIDTHGKPKET